MTQQVNLGKIENKARIQKINELKHQKLLELKEKQNNDLSLIVPTKPLPSTNSFTMPFNSNSIQLQQQPKKYIKTASETTASSPSAIPSRLFPIKADLYNHNTNISSQKTAFKQSISYESSKTNGSFSPKPKSTPATTKRNDETLQRNDVLTSIMASIDKQQPNKHKKTNEKTRTTLDCTYSIDDFIARIVSWRFVWLSEQGITYFLIHSFTNIF